MLNFIYSQFSTISQRTNLLLDKVLAYRNYKGRFGKFLLCDKEINETKYSRMDQLKFVEYSL